MNHFVLIRHKVRDFDTWKKGYDAHAPKRKEAGLSEGTPMRNADDPGEVVLLFKAQDATRAKAFLASADLRDTMRAVGVIDTPDVFVLNG